MSRDPATRPKVLLGTEQKSQTPLTAKGARFFCVQRTGHVYFSSLRFRRGLQFTWIAKLDADFVLRSVGRAMTHPAGSQNAVVFRTNLHDGGELDTIRIGDASAGF